MQSYEQKWSTKQALTTTADSENIINHGAVGVAAGQKINIQVTTAFSGGTSLKVKLVTGSTSSPSGETLWESETVLTASLVAGYKFALTEFPNIPARVLQYSKLVYTIDGTYTAGAIDAGIVYTPQTNK